MHILTWNFVQSGFRTCRSRICDLEKIYFFKPKFLFFKPKIYFPWLREFFLKNHKIINKFLKTNCFNIHHISKHVFSMAPPVRNRNRRNFFNFDYFWSGFRPQYVETHSKTFFADILSGENVSGLRCSIKYMTLKSYISRIWRIFSLFL